MNPLVSIIIPTKNSACTIRACLTSIQSQTYKNIECIVVDNHSSDTTQEIARELGTTVIVAGNERSAQRNKGAQESHGEYLLFADSDMQLSENVITECMQIMNSFPAIQAIVIPEKSFGTTFWARCKAFERSCYKTVPWMHGARFFRASAFKATSGFDERMIAAEDFDLHSKILTTFGKTTIRSSNETIMHDEGYLTLRKLLKKKFYYGANLHVYKKNQANTHSLRKQGNPFLRITLFFHDPISIFKHPIIFIGTCVMKMLEFCALLLGYLLPPAV
jgi:glycosyltransferase involved in cell wall biosynthesis